MDGRMSSRPGRLLLPAALLLIWGCAGCGGTEDAAYRLQEAAGTAVTLAGVDEDPAGIRMTTRQAVPGQAGSGLQANAVTNVEARSFVSLAEGAMRWKQKDPPQVVVIGEAWVRRHGIPASWLAEFRRMGIRQGSRPAVAVVGGTAEAFVRRPDAGSLGRMALEPQAVVRSSLYEAKPEYESDLALPFFALDPSGTGTGTDGNEIGRNPLVSVKAMLFKKQQLVAILPPQQSRLLVCLRGGSSLQEPLGTGAAQAALQPQAGNGGLSVSSVSCRTSVAANGDLQRPRLRIALHVNGIDASDAVTAAEASAYERSMYMQAKALIEQLQRLEIDPLNWGEAMRSQYPGFWTADRWRSAFAKASIQLDVNVHIRGGVTQ